MADQIIKLIMTIERTRELLGEKIAHLTDNEVLQFINKTDQLLSVLIKQAIKLPTSKSVRDAVQFRK